MAVELNSIITKLVLPARWLTVAGIAWSLALTALYLASSPQGQQPARPGNAEHTQSRHTSVNLNVILTRNLFGEADAVASVAADTSAAETNLPLELQGVFVAEEVAEESAAIVAQKGKSGLTYHIGDKIPGNAVLVAVHTDHIILRRAGNREKLTFPNTYNQFQVTANQAPPVSAPAFEDTPATSRSAREFITSHQAKMEADPKQALDDLGITPVSQDSARGYQLGNLAQSPYLSQTGLQPGDVILSVNGRAVGDMQADRLEIANILAQGSARLEVQRGTRTFFVTASLK